MKTFQEKMNFLMITFFAGFIGGFASVTIVNEIKGDGLLTQRTIVEERKIVERGEDENSTINVVEELSPSVVSIVVTKDLSEFQRRYRRGSALDDFFLFGDPFFGIEEPGQEGEPLKQRVGGGTGFIISEDGMILTNKHVVSDTEADYTVVLKDGKEYEAEVLGRDPINDLAIVKIKAEEGTLFPVAEVGDSEDIKIGQTVVAIGYSLGEYKDTVTKGIVSGIDRRIVAGGGFGQSEVIEEAIQTDAAINPGNSGGPLLNLSGQVIGINTAVSQSGQLIGFAIPINEAKNVIESVKKYGKIVRPMLGVRYRLIDSSFTEEAEIDIDYGALLVGGNGESAIVPDSAADKAGLKENDIIIEIDGVKVDENNNLAKIISKYLPEDEVSLKIYRDGETLDKTIVLQEFKENQ